MAKINGTDLLVYADGTLIACQTSCTVNFEQELPDASCKDDGGWAAHINGRRSASMDVDMLYSTTDLSAEELITYITGRESILLVCDGGGFPIVMEADPSSVSLSATAEEAVTVSGSFTATGGAYMLTGTFAALLTSWANGTYTTFTTSGTAVTSAISASGVRYANSNVFSVDNAGVYKVFTFLTVNSGQAPTVKLVGTAGGVAISNTESMTAGVNVVTLTATSADATSYLEIGNTAACNFALSKTYVFKV